MGQPFVVLCLLVSLFYAYSASGNTLHPPSLKSIQTSCMYIICTKTFFRLLLEYILILVLYSYLVSQWDFLCAGRLSSRLSIVGNRINTYSASDRRPTQLFSQDITQPRSHIDTRQLAALVRLRFFRCLFHH